MCGNTSTCICTTHKGAFDSYIIYMIDHGQLLILACMWPTLYALSNCFH